MDDVVACPTCWLLADVARVRHDALPHSVCPRGHEHALAPVVHEYLHDLLGPAFATP